MKPLREQNTALVATIRQLFASGDLFTCLEHSNETWLLSAQLRATHGLNMADAIHIATAIHNRCAFFLTNDHRLSSLNLVFCQLSTTTPTLEIIFLDDLVLLR